MNKQAIPTRTPAEYFSYWQDRLESLSRTAFEYENGSGSHLEAALTELADGLASKELAFSRRAWPGLLCPISERFWPADDIHGRAIACFAGKVLLTVLGKGMPMTCDMSQDSGFLLALLLDTAARADAAENNILPNSRLLRDVYAFWHRSPGPLFLPQPFHGAVCLLCRDRFALQRSGQIMDGLESEAVAIPEILQDNFQELLGFINGRYAVPDQPAAAATNGTAGHETPEGPVRRYSINLGQPRFKRIPSFRQNQGWRGRGPDL